MNFYSSNQYLIDGMNRFDICNRSSEDVLRGIFSAFGLVQTCIVNVEKRHAFVKMLTRNEAVVAKEGMERYKSTEMQLRVTNPPPPKITVSLAY